MKGEPGKLLGMFWLIKRWRDSTAFNDLSLEEQGAYRNLLDETWLRGGALPNDPIALARASGDPKRWPRLAPRVMKKFVLVDGMWRNPTLDKVWHQAQRRLKNQRNYRERGKQWSATNS